jgi:hypothetical protein
LIENKHRTKQDGTIIKKKRTEFCCLLLLITQHCFTTIPRAGTPPSQSSAPRESIYESFSNLPRLLPNSRPPTPRPTCTKISTLVPATPKVRQGGVYVVDATRTTRIGDGCSNAIAKQLVPTQQCDAVISRSCRRTTPASSYTP